MKAKTSRYLNRMGGLGWEKWRLPSLDGEKPVKEESGLTGANGVCSVPSRRVTCLCFWVSATEAEAVKTAVELEVEVRGFAPGVDDVFQLVRTWPEESRTLVSLPVFGNYLPDEIAPAAFSDYEAAPHLLELESDVVSLWPEGEDVVAAFTRGSRVVYWNTFSREEAVDEIHLTLLQLEAAGILAGPLKKISLHVALSGMNEALEAQGTRTVNLKTDWLPSLSSAQFGWKPEAVRLSEAKSGGIRKRKQFLVLAGAAYGAMILMALGYFAWLKLEVHFLKRQEVFLEGQLAELRPLAAEWSQIAPAAEPERFPLEILHQVVKSMPEEGIRLTVYALAGSAVSVEGEAASASLASQFFNAITGNPELKKIKWQMAPPTLLPNSTARFRMKGDLL